MAGTASMLSIGAYGEYSDEEETEQHSSGNEDEVKKPDENVESKKIQAASSVTSNLKSTSTNPSTSTTNKYTSSVASLSATHGNDDNTESSRLSGTDQSHSAIDNISDDESFRVEQLANMRKVSAAPPVDGSKEKKDGKTEEKEDKDLKIMKAKTRLVSYGDIEDKSESEKEDSDVDADPQRFLVISQDKDSLLKPEQASSLSRSVQNMLAEDIQLPPEPVGRCSRALQEKISNYYTSLKTEGHNLSHLIQQRKDFRNPSIYEKLIEFCQINEKGTNYPPEIFDPLVWGTESLYDSLDKMQKLDMEKREKERKERTKALPEKAICDGKNAQNNIEFVTGTKKTPSAADGPVEKKRKTKWDAQPQGPAAVAAAAALK